jgi:hypothetical protein
MENKYSRGKIYKITSSQTDKIYIGSTINPLHRRLIYHHCNIKRGSGVNSKAILKYDDAVIILIEDYPCKSKNELHRRERYHIENSENVINKIIPTRTKKEWKQINSETIRLKSKVYREKNKENTKAIRENRNTWCGNYHTNTDNNLLRISLDIFQ